MGSLPLVDSTLAKSEGAFNRIASMSSIRQVRLAVPLGPSNEPKVYHRESGDKAREGSTSEKSHCQSHADEDGDFEKKRRDDHGDADFAVQSFFCGTAQKPHEGP